MLKIISLLFVLATNCQAMECITTEDPNIIVKTQTLQFLQYSKSVVVLGEKDLSIFGSISSSDMVFMAKEIQLKIDHPMMLENSKKQNKESFLNVVKSFYPDAEEIYSADSESNKK